MVTLKDQAVAERRLQTLLGLLRLTGGSLPVDITSADVNGTSVTTITLKPEAAPAQPAVRRRGQHRHRGWAPVPRPGRLRDDGPGPGPGVIPGHVARYSAALTTAGTPNAGVIWVDAAAAAPLLVQMAGADSPSYETNIKPWVDALDSFMATATVDGDIASLKALLFVK